MPLNFDSSPYLQLHQQRREDANRPPPWANASQNILQGLQMLSDNQRQNKLMELQRQQLANQQTQQGVENAYQGAENAYKYGSPIDPNESVGVPSGQGASRLFSGGQPMSVGTGGSLLDQFNKFRAGGMKPKEARPEFMAALGEDERKKYQEISNPKPKDRFMIPQYDDKGNVTGYSEVPEGFKPFGGKGPQAPKKGALSSPDAEAAFNLYETARDGLLSGLEGSITGPVAGRFPAITSKQQIAEGAVAAMAPVLKQLFRVAGEGVFTDRDQALLLQMIPTRATNPEAISGIINNIDSIVKAKLRMSPESESSGFPVGGGNDLQSAAQAELQRRRQQRGR